MSNFQKFRQQNRNKFANKNEPFIQIGSTGDGSIGKAALEVILKGAKKSGALNLANKNLSDIPNEIYQINKVKSVDDNALSFDNKESTGWWDDVFLTKLILTSNKIQSISEEIIMLDKLTTLDISDNLLLKLPNEICELNGLVSLNVNKNKLSVLPENIGDLNELQSLFISENKLSEIPESIERLSKLEYIEARANIIKEFPQLLNKLTSLGQINLSYNQIDSMPYSLSNLKKLRTLDLSYNRIEFFTDKFSCPVTNLVLQVNNISTFPLTRENLNLKDLLLSHNRIMKLTKTHLSFIPNIVTLSLSSNKITDLPSEITKLTQLTSLDVSNNELTSLPLGLGRMDNLTGLSIDGNSFRSFKRSIVTAGTDAIKRYLLIRDTESDDAEIPSNASKSKNEATALISGIGSKLDALEVKRTGIVRLDKAGMTELSDEVVDMLLTMSSIKALILPGNNISIFPNSILKFHATLIELNLSNNNLKSIPDNISTLSQLQRLDLSNNKIPIGSLPLSLSKLTNLNWLNLSFNSIGPILPPFIYQLTNLRALLVSHCDLETFDASKINQMTLLDTLDLSNNEIANIPPELGLCEQIRTLNIDGNRFRVPRQNILSQGTNCIMEYLRSRIVK